jgi:cytochrome c peroxidase
LEDAIRHHLNAFASARGYRAVAAGVDRDLVFALGPIEPVLDRIDPILAAPRFLTGREFQSLVAFVSNGLLDPRARRQHLCASIPASLPSGMPPLNFEECSNRST